MGLYIFPYSFFFLYIFFIIFADVFIVRLTACDILQLEVKEPPYPVFLPVLEAIWWFLSVSPSTSLTSVHVFLAPHPPHYSFTSSHIPPLTCPLSHPGIKTSQHPTKWINHPWPRTNYPSLPTRCPPLRGEPCNNSTTWKSVVAQDWALMDAPVWPGLLRSPGQLTLKSMSLSNRVYTKETIVQDQGAWAAEMKCTGQDMRNHWFWDCDANEQIICCIYSTMVFAFIKFENNVNLIVNYQYKKYTLEYGYRYYNNLW